ncbi:MAG: hypothetical protein FD160_379 [Caulobacteraceae bacterium]|nr:MAG: hypothetical protein FD160_379 [Caulobacteraceae bacterium]
MLVRMSKRASVDREEDRGPQSAMGARIRSLTEAKTEGERNTDAGHRPAVLLAVSPAGSA